MLRPHYSLGPPTAKDFNVYEIYKSEIFYFLPSVSLSCDLRLKLMKKALANQKCITVQNEENVMHCFSRKKIFTSMNQSELLSNAYFRSIEFTTNNIQERVSSTSTRKEGVYFVERRSSFFLLKRTAPRCGVLVYV